VGSRVSKACIVYYRDSDREHANRVLEMCSSVGIEASLGIPHDDYPDVVIVVGGDGSVLQYLHDLVTNRQEELDKIINIPVYHVGSGKVNFFSDIDVNNITVEHVEKLRRGDYFIDERTLLEASSDRIFTLCLNEILVRFVNPGKICRFTVREVDGEEILSGRMDGVIVATATGSTAYILALGGPAVDYRLQDLKVIIPVAPFSPALVPIVHPVDVDIEVESEGTAILVADGMYYGNCQRVLVRKSKYRLKFVRTRPYLFYSRLSRRLVTS